MTTTNSLHHHYSFLKRLSTSESNLPPPPSFLFLHPTATSSTTTTTTTTTFSLSPPTSSTTSTSPTSQPISFDTLQHHLSTQNFFQADEETRRLLIVLAGEAAQKRGYVFFSEVQFIAEADLKAIDELWRQCSDNRFGYSVQKKLWQKANKDFTKFFLKVGWMKKLDTEIEQYNYRAFPSEFTWELSDETPEGHLPLTNALRGTQLLNSILSHPAFAVEEDEKTAENEAKGSSRDGVNGAKPLGSLFPKPNYSF
ncbi:Tetrapyrrole-binding protein [Hibiscus syriacus]|uniref:Tetrapyrrole-binding protein n=1 Tax=Hibiscus syriacus TaxID=106335 RepID=A0A6A3BLR2_HIBSY|nr:tetrapyrrole-binding protein, chloroplastic-like [Hibiscus syriacus]KAE8717574.1 Tetrapyrrole-binding protein [Hibiscus syriacus]